jgi:hypothetical protein
MFSGLMSRWTIPRACAYSSASAISPAMRTASAIGSCRSFVRRCRSVSPSTKGIT